MVFIDEDHLAGVYGVYNCYSPSSRAFVLGDREPRVVMGVEIPHNDSGGVLLLEEGREVRCVGGWA